ncbi:MAG: cell envelope integrity protein TolA [Ancalomicrobiaceae bacterium]|nr:cell envelope integrity protein TolA [Ancalomicrobiaceae bacterium]
MKPGLPFSIVLHAAVLGWALISFAGEPPMEAPPSDPIDVELLPPSDVSTPKLGAKTAKPANEIAPKELKASTKDQEGKRTGDTKVEEPPPPPPEARPTPAQEVKPAPPVEQKPTPVAELPKQEPPKPDVKPDPPKPVAKLEPPPPAPPEKPDLPKEAEKAKDVGEGKLPEVKDPPKDVKALDKLIAEKAKDEPKKPDPKPAEKPVPVKMASVAPSAVRPSAPNQSTSKLTGEVSSIQNHVQTGAQSSKIEQHASLGTPTGPNANVKLSQNEIDGFVAQIKSCWSPPIGAAESNITVRLRILLNPDGTLKAKPELIEISGAGNSLGPALAGSAIRAVQMCAAKGPFKMPADKYAGWAEVRALFDPKDM